MKHKRYNFILSWLRALSSVSQISNCFIANVLIKYCHIYTSLKFAALLLPLWLLLLIFVIANFLVIKRLLEASSKDHSISTEEALSWTQIWYICNLYFLVIGIPIEFIVLHGKYYLVILVTFDIRACMLWTVNKYAQALKNYLRETGSGIV